MAFLIGKLLKKPVITTCHGFFKLRWSRLLFPCWGDCSIAISDAVHKHLLDDFKLNPQMTQKINNGIDCARFNTISEEEKIQKRKAYGLGCEPVVGIVARLSEVKSAGWFLLKAMKNILSVIPDAKLVCVGEGKTEEKLRQLIKDLDLAEHVLMIPMVKDTNIFLSLMDVFVMPSRQEGLGLSVLEAQACGLPVVATRVGGLTSLISHGKTGLLVESENIDQLAEAIILALRDKEKSKEMGLAAKVQVKKLYDAHLMVSETLKVYRRFIST